MIPLLLHASDQSGLRAAARTVRRHIDSGPHRLVDIGHTLSSSMTDSPHRAVVLGADREHASSALLALVDGRSHVDLLAGTAATSLRPVFVFPGQGGIPPGMTRHLIDEAPVFARRMGECSDAVQAHTGWSVMDLLTGDAAEVPTRPDVLEPMLFSVMVSLAALWQDYGVEAQDFLGFSLGEIAASVVAGALDLDEAARVAIVWSGAHVPLVGKGSMAMLGVTVDQVRDVIARLDADAHVSGELAPRSTVVSGDSADVDRLVDELREAGEFAQKLSVDFAAHGPRTESSRDIILTGLSDIRPRSTDVRFYSGTRGGMVDTATLDADHWYDNLRQPVLFARATEAVLADCDPAFIELSAHPVLLTAMRDVVSSVGRTAPIVGSLSRDQQGLSRFVRSLSEAHVHGVEVDWDRHFTDAETVPLDLSENLDEGEAVETAGDAAEKLSSSGDELIEAVFGYIVDSVGRADGADFPSLDPSMRNIGLFDMGFDSVQLVRLQMRLQEHLGITLESTCIIDHPKVNSLLGEVNRALEADTGTEVPTAETRSVNRGHRLAPSRTEPIAVVGMSFRLPGDIRTLKQLWTVLDEGIDVVGPVPPARWAHSGLDTGEITTTEGGYLSDVEEFDAGFFNISPVEAVHIDPQQRLLLELTWEAFEDAGMDPRAVGADQRVGVFVAIYNNDYRQVGRDFGHTHDAYAYTGNMANAAAGRISYTFGFRGPSMAIDTACSSSLYALHLACQELRSGSCDVVVTAGVNLILSPEGHLSWSRLGALAPSGRCRSFDEHADGYIRSEGGVVVVLKRLSDAERDGDTVFAVLKGSAVSHNGTSGGFTVPNGRAQTQVVHDAMEAAGVGVEDISYIEAHGSGTPIGDPQELNALARVFEGRTDKVVVGSVKSNIGHLESAAGMAALCKVILCLQQGRLPGTLHFTRGNPLVDWESAPFEVSADGTTWGVPGLRRAGISSFGISGTNAHLIVEEYPTADRSTAAATPERPHLLAVSAHSRPLLGKALADLAAWGESTSADLRDVAFTLGRRAHLEHRHAILCDSVSDIAAAVAAADVDTVPPATNEPVFVFAGQGTTYPGMARELFDRSELFRSELEGLDAAFRAAGDIDLLEVMFRGDEEAFRSPLYTQPLIFAVELALARYWESLGVRPVAVVGHSIGEYAAACFAGVLDRDAAVELVMRRAEVMASTPVQGAMATLLCAPEVARDLMADQSDVHIAAINASENVTVSGTGDALTAILKAARKRRVFVERLDVSHPFHSPHMADSARLLQERIHHLSLSAPRLPWISSQLVEAVSATAMIDTGYWSRHLVEPVRFADTIRACLAEGWSTFLEIGAMTTLSGLIAQEFPDEAVVVPGLRKGRSDVAQVLTAAATLWNGGLELRWDRLEGAGHLVHDLPHTPYDRRRLWYQERTGEDHKMPTPTTPAPAPDTAVQTAARESVAEFIRTSIAQVSGVPAAELEDSTQLFSLGIDSLMLVQLGKRIDREYGLDLPIKVFFESLHTPGAVVDHIMEFADLEDLTTDQPEEPSVPADAAAPSGTAEGPVASPAVATIPAASQPALVPVAVNAPVAEGVEGIIRSQLAVMQQQLGLLGGAPALPAAPTQPQTGAVPVHPHAAPAAEQPEQPRRRAKKVGSYNNNIVLDEDPMTDRQREFVEEFVRLFTAKTRRSAEYAREHRSSLADWINSLNFNPSLKETAYPVVSSRSRGGLFWDLDGNEYIDTGIGYGVHFFGHQPDFVMDAVRAQLDSGYELGPQNKLAGKVAKLVHEMTGAERVAFCNTGTEAVMVSLRLARAASGRDKIVRFTDSYHGSSDGVLAETDGERSVPLTIGIPQAMVDNTIVLGYGSQESLEEIRRMGDDLAAVLVEPVQSRNPGLQPKEFLRELRQICTEKGIALIFDEMIVGFRLAIGGAQEFFGVESDMSLYGKLVGGGLPIGIVAGKSTYLDAVDGGAFTDADDSCPAAATTFFAGTFCKHPLTMAACHAVLTHLKESGAAEITRLNAYTKDFVQRANDWFDAQEVPIRLSYCASMYKYETVAPRDVTAMTLTTNLFFKILAYLGVFVWERRCGYFSLVHTQQHKTRILEAFRVAVDVIRAGGFDFRRAGSTGPRDEIELSPTRLLEPYASSAVCTIEKRIYVLSHMRGGNEAYQVPVGLTFDGPLDRSAVAEAFAVITERHPRLRASYRIENGEILTALAPEVTPEAHHFDRIVDPSVTDEQIADIMTGPLDLSQAPLWRYAIVVDADGTNHLLASFHHIIVDGNSLDIILEDLAEYLTDGRVTRPVSDDYSSFVAMQANLFRTPGYEADSRWWLDQFQDVPADLPLPTDSPVPAVNDFSGHHYYFRLDQDLYEAADRFARANRITPFVLHLTVWAALLGRTAATDDVCVGVPLDQRILGRFERTVGMFAQSLPLRIRPSEDKSLLDLAAEVRDTSLSAIEHSRYSYDELIQELDLVRDYGHNTLFDVMFIYTNARERVRSFGDLTATGEDFGMKGSMLAMTLELTERDGGLFADLTYSDVFSRRRVAGLMDQYRTLLARAVEEPERSLGELSSLDVETTSALAEWGAGPVRPIPDLAEALNGSFAAHADRPAVSRHGSTLSYAELSARIDSMAALLQAEGVDRGDVVGLLLPICPDLVVTMLAVHRIGATWLPMDVNHPVKRIATIVEAAAAVKVVTTAELAETHDFGDRAFVVDEDRLAGAGQPRIAPGGPDDLAYVIFTSGSTGAPKGVAVSNHSLANFVVGMPEALQWRGDARTAVLTSPSFDIFMLETVMILAVGGTLVMGDAEDGRSPAAMADFLREGDVDCLQVTPTRLRLLYADPAAAERAMAGLHTLVVGGEAFPAELLERLQQHEGLRIFNVYGPTETCIWSGVKDLTDTPDVTIGRPIANTTFHILDDGGHLVPEGVAGHLWIGGAGVSPGYLNRPDLNETVFRPSPAGDGRIYRTGDYAMWNSGEARCLGRSDNQVKVRGYRIELEEIEAAMGSHEQVTGAVVAVDEVSAGNQVLRGFYTSDAQTAPTPADLNEFLSQSLPAYMVPATFLRIDSIPMTASGKADRKAVLAAAPAETPQEKAGDADGVTDILVAGWKKVLGDVTIGLDTSFFDLGGNSFSLVLLLEELDSSFPGAIDVTDLFSNPTVNALARHIEKRNAQRVDGAMSLPVPEHWLSSGRNPAGHIQVALDASVADAVRPHHDGRSGLMPAVVAMTLGKMLDLGQVAVNTIDGNRVLPLSVDLTDKNDLSEVVTDCRDDLANVEAVDLDRLRPARGVRQALSVAYCTAGAVTSDLLSHVDLVVAVSESAQAPVAAVIHRAEVDSTSAELLLTGFVKVLGMVAGSLSEEASPATEYATHQSASIAKDQA